MVSREAPFVVGRNADSSPSRRTILGSSSRTMCTGDVATPTSQPIGKLKPTPYS